MVSSRERKENLIETCVISPFLIVNFQDGGSQDVLTLSCKNYFLKFLFFKKEKEYIVSIECLDNLSMTKKKYMLRNHIATMTFKGTFYQLLFPPFSPGSHVHMDK